MKQILSLIPFVFFSLTLHAQGLEQVAKQSADKPVAFRLGIYGDFSWNFHKTTANVYCCDYGCGVFSNGTGKGFDIGFLGEIPVFGKFEAYATAGFAQRGGKFGDALNSKLPIKDPNDTGYTQLHLTNSYTATIPEIIAGLGLKFTPFKKIPFYVKGGLVLNFPFSASSTYVQTDHISSPQGVVFQNNTVDTIAGSGPIINLKETFGVSCAIGYPVPLSERLTAAPEVEYYFPFTQVKQDYHWTTQTLQAGVALRYSFYKVVPTLPPPPPPPTPPPPPPAKPVPPVAYVGLAEPKSVSVYETTVTETFPVLPYIFFDSASTNFVPRYHVITSAERSKFNESSLPHNSLGAYYHILNIIGKRMAEKPEGAITLNGTTDGREVSSSATKELASSRAETVKKYFTDVWGIDPDRIEVKASKNPTIPSSLRDTAGVSENRRVEILAEDESLLAPVVHAQFKEYAITPEAVPFAMSVRASAPVASWKLDVGAHNKNVYSAGGAGEPPAIIAWKLGNPDAEKIAATIKGSEKLTCALDVTDNRGIVGSSNVDLPATLESNPYEISRLSLVVFDFDKADINDANKKMVSEFVSKTIHDGSTVSITGTTDAMGELDHNKELSTSRAFAVHKLIKEENAVAQVTKVEGIGPTYSPEMNSTPEGRYYCRTVTVQVQTPLK